MSVDVAANLKMIQDELDSLTGDEADSQPALIAVSKKQPVARIEAALEVGQRLFGENRVEDAAEKWPALKKQYPDIELHLVGSLQSKKTRVALELFEVIHSLDREKLAKTMAAEIKDGAPRRSLFIQVNTGKESQKSGILPNELPDFYQFCQELNLPIIGLMCLPPVEDDSGVHFAWLKKSAGELGLDSLSMGMSQDYQLALRFGATHVRLGTSIFGPRPT